MPDRSLDRAIDGLARRQHGVFHRRQAVRAGFTRSMIRRRVGSGAARLPRLAAGAPRRRHSLRRPDEKPPRDVHHSSTIGRFTVVEGIRVVSPADCVVQLAHRLDAEGLGALVDDVARTRRQLLPELRDRYVALAHSRLPGIANLRAALEERGDGHVPPASELKRHLRQLARRDSSSFGRSGSHAAVVGAGAAAGRRADPGVAARPRGRRRDWHTRRRDFERDRWRDTVALANGYATVRFTWHQLVQRPTWCRNALVAIGADRSRSDVPRRAA